MKRLQFASAAMFFAVCFATTPYESMAQAKKGAMPFGWNKLSLTAEQKMKVVDLVEKHRKHLADLKAQEDAAKTKHREELNAILTPTQRAELLKILGLTNKTTDKAPEKTDKK